MIGPPDGDDFIHSPVREGGIIFIFRGATRVRGQNCTGTASVPVAGRRGRFVTVERASCSVLAALVTRVDGARGRWCNANGADRMPWCTWCYAARTALVRLAGRLPVGMGALSDTAALGGRGTSVLQRSCSAGDEG